MISKEEKYERDIKRPGTWVKITSLSKEAALLKISVFSWNIF